MHSAQEDENSVFKLAQLWYAVQGTQRETRQAYSHNRIVNEILKGDFNINCKVTINRNDSRSKKHLKDCTALHFVYCDVYDMDTFGTLLQRGADFTLKNGNGHTVLHLAFLTSPRNYSTEIPFINAVLSAHVKFQNPTNPVDANGLSHLHGACIVNHVEAVDLFLNNGVSIEQAINSDSPQFTGYTPLHFAAEFHSFAVAKVLVSRGANVNALTTKRRSPLDLLFRNRHGHPSSREKDEMVMLLVEREAVTGVGLPILHIACTFKDLTIAEYLLNVGAKIDYAMSMRSCIYPGNTALHFAADNSVEAVKLLLRRGAKIDVANAQKLMPLDLCIRKYSWQDICDILSCVDNLKEIHLSDGETRLLDLMTAMGNLERFRSFLKSSMADPSAVVPNSSPIFPGYSILHLAVTLSRSAGAELAGKRIVEECLSRGLSVNVQNARGETPIHLAFDQESDGILRSLLERLKRSDELTNVADKDNLTYLHIACAVQDESLAERLLAGGCEPNVACRGKSVDRYAGSTPLHIAAANGSHEIAGALLRHGANLHESDAHGLGPIHWLLDHSDGDNQEIAEVLLGALLDEPQERVVEGFGLSYLHVACRVGNVEAARRLLDSGSDVNALVRRDRRASQQRHSKRTVARLCSHVNVTPLQMAIAGSKQALVELLLRRGADAFASEPALSSRYPSSAPVEDKSFFRRFCRLLLDHDEMQERMARRFGLSRLHVACYLKDEEAIRGALAEGHDANGLMDARSPVFAGCAPLHLLVTLNCREHSFAMRILVLALGVKINLLLDHGADVTIADAEGNTPIHILYKYRINYTDGYFCGHLLLNAHRDLSVNPMNADGLTHLHLACFWHNEELIEQLLLHGSVDVNQPIGWLTSMHAGYTALHLTLDPPSVYYENWEKTLRIVELLLEHGASVTAKDVRGDTPLHKPAVLRSPQMSILDKLVSYGGDLKSENIQGQTPIMVILNYYSMISVPDCVRIFQKFDYKINSWNRLTNEGHIAKLFLLKQRDLTRSFEFEQFIKTEDVKTVDYLGRTAIHNSVAFPNNRDIKNHIHAIDSFIKLGIDVDHRDITGRTALHYAAQMENVTGVEALLLCGADVNVVDNTGKSAFSYAVNHSESKGDLCHRGAVNATIVLRLHMKKLKHLGIEISQLNQNLIKRLQHYFDNPRYKTVDNPSQIFFNQIEMTKTLNIRTSPLTLFDFLSETGALSYYAVSPKPKRDQIDDFIKSIDCNEFREISGIIKLQFKKTITRLELIDSALRSLRLLLGFSVPDLCEEISRFLSNSDLKNLIESTRSKTKKRKRCATCS